MKSNLFSRFTQTNRNSNKMSKSLLEDQELLSVGQQVLAELKITNTKLQELHDKVHSIKEDNRILITEQTKTLQIALEQQSRLNSEAIGKVEQVNRDGHQAVVDTNAKGFRDVIDAMAGLLPEFMGSMYQLVKEFKTDNHDDLVNLLHKINVIKDELTAIKTNTENISKEAGNINDRSNNTPKLSGKYRLDGTAVSVLGRSGEFVRVKMADTGGGGGHPEVWVHAASLTADVSP